MRVSIIDKSLLEGGLRIDAEYYHPDNLKLHECVLRQNKTVYLRDAITTLTDMGAFSLYKKEYLTEKGVPLLRVNNVGVNNLNLDNLIFISSEYHDILIKSQIKYRDVLLTTKAIIGNTCTVPKTIKNCNMSQNLVRMRFNFELPNPYYVSTFLSSKYGIYQTSRLATGNVQLYLNFENINDILIPQFSNEFYKHIENTICGFDNAVFRANKYFNEAQNLLLTELGLNDWKPKHQLTFIRNYSDTVQVERIDAEYFQPKYDEIINVIKAYKGGWDELENLVKIKKGVEVGSGEYLDEGIPFIRVSNISPFELTKEKNISGQLYAELTKNHQPQQGEILFSKDGSPGIAYYLKDKPQKMIVSGGILRLKNTTENVSNEYLTLILNSVLVQEQVKRDVGGSIILHWRPDQVKRTILPILSQPKQQEIQQKVIKSFELRKQSKQLLENAKRAVEMAIEEDESKAIQWLEAQCSALSARGNITSTQPP